MEPLEPISCECNFTSVDHLPGACKKTATYRVKRQLEPNRFQIMNLCGDCVLRRDTERCKINYSTGEITPLEGRW